MVTVETTEKTETVTTKEVTLKMPLRVAQDLLKAMEWYGSVNTVAETADVVRALRGLFPQTKGLTNVKA